MSKVGPMIVDWEERINMDRMRRERLQKVKDAMAKLDVDVLLLFREDYTRYVTGYRYLYHPVPQVGKLRVVLVKGEEPILHTWEYETMKTKMPWMPADNLRPPVTPEMLTQEVGRYKEGRIAVDIWNPYQHEELPRLFPKATWRNGEQVMNEATIIKTQDEIECLKTAYVITEAGLHAAIQSLKPGARECEILGIAWGEMTRLGSEYFQTSCIVAAGASTAPYRRLTSDLLMRSGDPVIMDVGGCWNGYWGDTTRTWLCGNVRPTREQIELHQSCYDSLHAACAAAQPGNTTADVFRAAEPNILGDGVLGHGSSVVPAEPPMFIPSCKDNPMTLRPGMAFNLETYAGRPGIGGFRLEHQLVLTENGPEIFSTYPFDARLLKDIHPLDKFTG
ncbi:MAG: aminopeptidase P family protein [Chloroflexi bacterium]|nr:aminopeptidase P family protein [Chloroflexota bacterium]